MHLATQPADSQEGPPPGPTRAPVSLGVRDTALIVGLAIGLVYLYAPTVAWLFDRWTISVWHNIHGMFVPPAVAYLVWLELRPTRDGPRDSSAWGFAFVVPGLLMLALDAGMHTQLLSAFSIIVLLPGLSLLLLGRSRTRRIAMPLAFLMFMLPIPLSFTQRIHLVLREIATAGSSGIVDWLGIPVFTEETTIYLAGATLQVADACSGFSTLYASVAVAALLAYMNPSPWRRLGVLAVAAPIAVAANIIRVTLLVLLVLWLGDEILDTALHTISGLLTFAAALPVILWVGRESEPPA